MQDSVVIVTGGGRGIGRAICERFAADGAQIVAAARSADELAAVRTSIESANGRCHVRETDVAVPSEIDALVEDTEDRFGRIDVLVNCAGVVALGGIDVMKPAVFDLLWSVNVSGVYHACRAVWPIMKRQGVGVIVNISSVASIDPFPGFAAYGAAKAWVNAWTNGLADEGRASGIRVFAVAPGAVETRMLRDPFPDFPADQTLAPSAVADVVHTLAQPACRYATGQVVFIKK